MACEILIPEQVSRVGIDYLTERGYSVNPGIGYSEEDIKKEIVNCDGVLTRICPLNKEVLKFAKKLKVISKHGIGVDNIDIDYCTENGIQVTYTPEVSYENIAEHALYLILACAKNGYAMSKHFRERGDFEARNKFLGVELVGKTIGIIGLGRIGGCLAKKCIGIGMKVIGYDPYISKEQLGADIRIYRDCNEVFRNADFISLHLPCNRETKGSLGIKEFELMKGSAFFINVSRGGIVIEKDLIHALKSNIIRGAGVDVFENEPVPISNELLYMENVIATPHSAGSTQESIDEVSLHAAMGIDEVLSGKPVTWPVNKLNDN